MKPEHKFTEEEHQRFVDGKRQRRMDMVDGYPPEIRHLVHEYGLNLVKTFLDHSITRPRIINHIVQTVLDEFSPTRGAYSRQGVFTRVGAHPSAAKLEETTLQPTEK